MKNKSRIKLSVVALFIATLACNLPSAAPQSPAPEIQTAAALTIQAMLTPSITSTIQQSILGDSSSPTPVLTTTITPTFSTPILTVLQQTNCRTGPGQDYEVTFTYLPNAKLIILGRYDIENYWLVKSDESPTGQCWLWGEFVEVSGSYWVVSSVTPPPTATQKPPQAPSIQNWEFLCSVGQMTIEIDWTDRSENETGYRVFRDGNLVAELAANSTTYTETITLLTGESAEYFIQVYNSTAEVNSTPIKLTC